LVTKKVVLSVVFILIITIGFAAYGIWRTQPLTQTSHSEKTLFQVSAYYPMSLGAFEGNLTYGDLAGHGDFGIGAFNGMDGEMIALDGAFFQVRTDGVPRAVDMSLKTPFAMVTFFDADQTVHVQEALNYSQLTAYIDNLLPTQDGIYAIKIHGDYSQATTRSVPQQTKPYPTLAEVVKNQTTFQLSNVFGTAVGYRCPNYMNGTDVPGYHLHFLTDSHTAGGHLLNCVTSNVTIEIDHIESFEMTTP
jgi:acetolactate decarboxylase